MIGGPPLFPKKPSRGRHVGTAALVLVVGGGLYAASRLSHVLFERPAPLPATLAAAAPGDAAAAGAAGARIFQVVSAEGQVDAYRDGRWIAIQKGDLLTRDDLVRTVAGAHAVLRLSQGGEIELREKVEIRLDRLSAAGSIVDLRHGKVVARVAAASDTLAITARETTTSTEGPAHVVVQADEHGQVSVATLKGKARFASAGKTVELPEGTQTRSARAGAPPEDPERIPEDVLLQVVWPEVDRHTETAQIEGHVRPDSLVTINGAETAVGQDGRFSATVPLREGGNPVSVRAEDLVGRKRAAAATLTRPSTRLPKLAREPGDLWNVGGERKPK
jgi:Glucodextranase, domain B/FecR protein